MIRPRNHSKYAPNSLRYCRSCLCLIDIAQAPSLYNIIIEERTRVGENGQVLGMFMHSSFGELNKSEMALGELRGLLGYAVIMRT